MYRSLLHPALAIALSLSVLGGCASGSAKVMRDPVPLPAAKMAPLSSPTNADLAATLDWIIVPEGPGSWVRNADWDEYLVRVQNLSEDAITLTGVVLVDSLQGTHPPETRLQGLRKASRANVKRYAEADLEVRAGAGTGALVAVGTGVTVAGAAAASAAWASAGFFSGAAAAGTGAAAIGTGLILAGPVLAVGGIIRGANHAGVDRAIMNRTSVFPLRLDGEGTEGLNLFFPIAPAPRTVHLHYRVGEDDRTLVIELPPTLAALHLEPPADNTEG